MPLWEFHFTLDIAVDTTAGGWVAIGRLIRVTEGNETGGRFHGDTPDEVEHMAHSWFCTQLFGSEPPSARPTATAEDPVF